MFLLFVLTLFFLCLAKNHFTCPRLNNSTASKGIKELTKEYNSFDGHAVKKSGSQTREELIKADVARIRKETRPVCLAAKEALKEQKKKLPGTKDAELRMREQMFRVTAQSYIESVKGYQNAHAMYEEAVRSTMRRHLDYTVPDYSSEQKEQIIDEGRAQEVCQAVMMSGSSDLANTYKDVSEQHKVRMVVVVGGGGVDVVDGGAAVVVVVTAVLLLLLFEKKKHKEKKTKEKQIQIKTNDDPADFPPRCGFHALALKTFVTTEDTSQSTKNNARRFDI
jgi:hypothetical protein